MITETYIEKYRAIDKPSDCSSIEKLETFLKCDSRYEDFHSDFWSAQPIFAAISLAELIDKITDGEIVNTFCLFPIAYRFPLNLKLSPLALAISFFNFKQLQVTRPQSSTEFLYTKKTLPKITYICFTGYYSELDIDVLYQFSENVQVIMIYDAQTGGPDFWNDDTSDEQSIAQDSRVRRINFRSISDKILLLPLDTSNENVTSRNFYDLFEQAVYRSLRAFKPDLVAINHPFTFDPEQSSCRFGLKPKTWSKILFEICEAVNYKVLILPHKLRSPEQEVKLEEASTSDQSMTYFIEKVIPQFCHKLNSKLFEEYFGSSLEVMASKINSGSNVI